MPHIIQRCLLSYLTTAVLLVQGCATPRDLSLVERASGGMQIDLPATSRLSKAEVCHALRYHVLDFNKHGQLEFPQTNFDCFKDTSDYRNQCENQEIANPQQITPDQRLACQLNAIRDNIEAGRADGQPYDHIVLVVHGGLVAEDEGLREAITATRAMTADTDGDGHYYPIFVVWRSGALPAYGEQATRMEQGKRSATFARVVAPLTIASDLARGVVREPRFGASEGVRLWNSTLLHKLTLGDGKFRCRDMQRHMLANRSEDTRPGDRPFNVICPTVDEADDSILTQGFKTSAYVLSTPLRMVTTPILLGPGQSAWENMQRRARNLVWRDSDKRDQALPDSAPPAVVEGGLQVMFRDLLMPLTAHRDGPPERCKLTLIGHSMGAIVITEMLRLHADLEFDNMVLMGAAVDMRGFIYAVRASQAVSNAQAYVYNLSLHPDNEVFEASGGGSMPSGSLLQWIDEAYETPPTQLDRVLGKWTNLPALERTIPARIAPKLSFKMFGFDDGEPQTHGAFNDLGMCYWRKSFWDGTPWPTHRSRCRALINTLDSAAP